MSEEKSDVAKLADLVTRIASDRIKREAERRVRMRTGGGVLLGLGLLGSLAGLLIPAVLTGAVVAVVGGWVLLAAA